MFFIVVAHELHCRRRNFARPALSLRTHQRSANPYESNPWSTLALHLIASNYSFASSFNRALQILCNYSDCLVISKSHELICASLATCLPTRTERSMKNELETLRWELRGETESSPNGAIYASRLIFIEAQNTTQLVTAIRPWLVRQQEHHETH